MLDRNYKILYERNSEKAEKIAEWGYDPKALYNVLRIGWFILDFAESTKSYANCLEGRSIYKDVNLKSAKTERWTLHAVQHTTKHLYEIASKAGKDFIDSDPKEKETYEAFIKRNNKDIKFESVFPGIAKIKKIYEKLELKKLPFYGFIFIYILLIVFVF